MGRTAGNWEARRTCGVTARGALAADDLEAASGTRHTRAVVAALTLLCLLGSSQGVESEQSEGPVQIRLNSFHGQHPPLTSFGSSIRTVVFAGVTYEGVCSASRHGGMDWRGMLPRYLANRLGPDTNVLVWNSLRASRESNFTLDCEICRGDVSARNAKPVVSCRSWFKQRGLDHAELLVVVGTGHSQCKDCVKRVRGVKYGELKWPLRQPWVGKATKSIHIPISRTNDVLRNRVANFTKVIQDGTLVKPVHVPNLAEWRQTCSQIPRENRLVYVARYHDWKGQVEFLKWVNPTQLNNYTVHFYSSSRNADMQLEMARVAERRNISVKIHSTPLMRGELLNELCAAKGAVHYAHTDANPRALYESLLAQLPVFITSESRIPRIVMRQPFVTAVKFGDKAELQDRFQAFMLQVQNSLTLRQQISEFVDTELVEERALGKVCQEMGICGKDVL
eukprot:jgi/Tetstr1/444131/TSEL_032029.t1